jgi:hypothetical protein
MSRIALAASLLAGAVVVFVAYALLARFVLHGPVGPGTLQVSVERTAGSALPRYRGRCRRARRSGDWRCTISDHEGSGGVTYRVSVRPGSSCWHGEIVEDLSEGAPMPRKIDDCVHLWQWSLL